MITAFASGGCLHSNPGPHPRPHPNPHPYPNQVAASTLTLALPLTLTLTLTLGGGGGAEGAAERRGCGAGRAAEGDGGRGQPGAVVVVVVVAVVAVVVADATVLSTAHRRGGIARKYISNVLYYRRDEGQSLSFYVYTCGVLYASTPVQTILLVLPYTYRWRPARRLSTGCCWKRPS